MTKKITTYIKNNPITMVYIALAAFFVAVFTSLFSFYVLQSDDYYYASFFKNGLGEFFRLTKDHFLSFNGRAVVHFFTQIMLSLPPFVGSLLNSLTVFFIALLSFGITNTKKSIKSCSLFIILFYALLSLTGRDIIKEALMWVSAFYNYVFPLLFVMLALYFSSKNRPLMFVFCFLAGATTEQWGITAIVMIFFHVLSNLPQKPKFGQITLSLLPCLVTCMGYITIYLSPATQGRIIQTGHTTLAASLSDLPRLGKILLSDTSAILPLTIFIVLTVLTALVLKKRFSLLYSGLLPLFLILTVSIHKAYLATLIIFICYLCLCLGVFFFEKHPSSVFISGALAAILIMMPTNTFESRVCFPTVILIILACVNIIFSLGIFIQKKKTAITLSLVCALSIFSLAVFYPTYTGFMKNSIIEHENLQAIRQAKSTGELYYNIDYDKKFAMKQMFNDGWFYTQFLSLYSLEDCTVYLESANSVALGNYKTKGLIYNGDIYIPMRTFIEEAGGSISIDTSTIITLGERTLSLYDGILTYQTPDAGTKYLIADDNRILNFYTLYLRSEVVNDALGTDLPTMKKQ